jgi:hypothetical protein
METARHRPLTIMLASNHLKNQGERFGIRTEIIDWNVNFGRVWKYSSKCIKIQFIPNSAALLQRQTSGSRDEPIGYNILC